MRTAAYNDGTASDHRRRQNVLGHILYFALKCEKCVKSTTGFAMFWTYEMV